MDCLDLSCPFKSRLHPDIREWFHWRSRLGQVVPIYQGALSCCPQQCSHCRCDTRKCEALTSSCKCTQHRCQALKLPRAVMSAELDYHIYKIHIYIIYTLYTWSIYTYIIQLCLMYTSCLGSLGGSVLCHLLRQWPDLAFMSDDSDFSILLFKLQTCKETLCLTFSLGRFGAHWVLQPGQNQVKTRYRSASVPVAPSARSASGPSRRASPKSPGGCGWGSLGVSGPKWDSRCPPPLGLNRIQQDSRCHFSLIRSMFHSCHSANMIIVEIQGGWLAPPFLYYKPCVKRVP